MQRLLVLVAILIGVVYSSTTEKYSLTLGESIDSAGLIKLGRQIKNPMLTLFGLALQNIQKAMHDHPCEEWTPWSPCDASRLRYFGSQSRTRSCADTESLDGKNMTIETANKLCEGFCPVSYNLTNNGFCIKLNTTKVTNDEAVEQCKQDGGYLIHIDSHAKYDDVKSFNFPTNVHNFHIDGRRKDSTSPWKYQYGSETAFLKWHPGYPNNSADRLCLVYSISSNAQHDYSCSYSRPFICEITYF